MAISPTLLHRISFKEIKQTQIGEINGDLLIMKRALFVSFSALMLCILLLLITVGTTQAADPDYTRLEYPTLVEPTVDGMWTSDDEWTDGNVTMIGENVTFRSTYSTLSTEPVTVATNFVIEILNDNTNDTGDYWQICIDGTLDGANTPMDDDFRIDFVGHTNLTVYQGTVITWTEVTPEAGELNFSDSISASPTSSTPHWIAEFSIVKTEGVILLNPEWGLRVAVYDESNSAAGVQAWPPLSDRDVPNGWGLNTYSENPIPEGLSFGVVVLSSSVAVIIGYRYFRKRSSSGKREK